MRGLHLLCLRAGPSTASLSVQVAWATPGKSMNPKEETKLAQSPARCQWHSWSKSTRLRARARAQSRPRGPSRRQTGCVTQQATDGAMASGLQTGSGGRGSHPLWDPPAVGQSIASLEASFVSVRHSTCPLSKKGPPRELVS